MIKRSPLRRSFGIRLGAGLLGVGFLSAGLFGAATVASPNAAQAETFGAQLPASVTVSAYAGAVGGDTTQPQVVCPSESACPIESSGTASSVRIGLFALEDANARLTGLNGATATTRFAIYDASGAVVRPVEGFACSDVPWTSGTYILCANSDPSFRVTVPAGGRLAPAPGSGTFGVVLGRDTGVWPIGHDFADKNHAQTTVYDRAILKVRASGSFTVGGPLAFAYDAVKVPAGSTASVAQDEDIYFGSTSTTLRVQGLLPNRSYGAHVHVNACGPAGADAGGHYQNEPSTDPRAANPQNEIWLDFTTDRNGAATATSTVSWIPRAGQGASVVIHDLATAAGGAAGARVACLTLGR